MGRRARRRKRTSGLSLLLAIDKPFGQVTRSVDNFVADILQDDGVGHAGTLDPAVTGVVVMGVGQAKKLIPLLEDGKRKAYAARIDFGTQTDTDDAEGHVIREAGVSNVLRDLTYANEVLSSFVGTIQQVPPRYSAIKVNGVRAYELARSGVEFELPAREVQVFEASLKSIDTEHGVSWNIDFVVSGGTYIRALARDIGLATNGAAHLGKLCRTASGNVSLEQCVTCEQVRALGAQGIHQVALDPAKVLGLSCYRMDESELAFARNGRPFAPRNDTEVEPGTSIALVQNGMLYGVWQFDAELLRPKVNCPDGVIGVCA